jgi:hypothetical protein
VQQFKTNPKKGQALLLNSWYIDGQIPPVLGSDGFISRLNINWAEVKEEVENVKKYVRATTFTTGGLLAKLRPSITGIDPPADLFDFTISKLTQALTDLVDAQYNADETHQARGDIQQQVQYLSQSLTIAGFDPDDAGIY